MGRKLGPETKEGQVMKEAEYVALWSKLSEQKRGVLSQLCQWLGVGVIPERRTDGAGYASDVGFGPYGGIERVEGRTATECYAKALALGIDRRLSAIVQARAALDEVTNRIDCPRTMMQLERLILSATAPTSMPSRTSPGQPSGEPSTTSDTKKGSIHE